MRLLITFFTALFLTVSPAYAGLISGQPVLSTDAEAKAGSSTTKVLTPANLAVATTFQMDRQAASSSASLNFTGIDSTSDLEEFHLLGIVAGTTGQELHARISTDNGSTWKSGVSDYAWKVLGINTTNTVIASGSDGDTELELTDQFAGGTTSGYAINGTVRVFTPSSTSLFKLIEWDITMMSSSGEHHRITGSGRYTTAASAVNGIQFFFASGNIASGVIVRHRYRTGS